MSLQFGRKYRCVSKVYVRDINYRDSSSLDNKLIPCRIKVSFPISRILSDISSLLAKPYELKHNRYCYVFTTVFPIGIHPVSHRIYTLYVKKTKGIDTFRTEIDIDLSFHFIHTLPLHYTDTLRDRDRNALRDTGS